jgi:hypothetical protein
MSDLDFCKTRLEEIVDHTASPAKLLVKVQEFVAHRLPEEAADRADLKAWAETELTKLEERTPGGGVAQIGTAPLAKTGRRMLMLQSVIHDLDAAASSSGDFRS